MGVLKFEILLFFFFFFCSLAPSVVNPCFGDLVTNGNFTSLVRGSDLLQALQGQVLEVPGEEQDL